MLKMFNRNKKIDNALYSPINGKCILLEDVPDDVFATKMMGEGVGLVLSDNTIYSPCNATISIIANTKHAVGLSANNGMEILIHIGLDTVELNGEGFEILVQRNDAVKKGQPLVRINLDVMNNKNINLISPMVITNSNDIEIELVKVNGEIFVGETILANRISK